MLKATPKHNVSLKSVVQAAQVDFYGHTLRKNGIQPAKENKAIRNVKSPSNIGELQTILGMVTYLNRF